MSEIINLTDVAINKVKELLAQKKAANIFRIAVNENKGCSGLKYDIEIASHPKPSDEAVKIADDLTVYVDKESIKHLQGSTLDCEKKDLGLWQWVFQNPQAASSCGCGESFTNNENDK